MPIIVSDTSPLRALSHLGQLDLVAALYGEVVLPPAVADELLQPRTNLPTIDARTVTFIRIAAPSNTRQVQSFLQTVDAGEAEALALAIELQADLILIDEKRARNLAAQHGFTVIGTIGILLAAKSNGLIHAVKPLMERLINEINFFLSARFQADVLQRAGE